MTSRVLFIAYFFPPVGGAGVQRALSFAKYLPAEGILPTVVTGPTSMDDHWAPEDSTLVHAIPSRVPVHRVSGPLPPADGRWRRRVDRWLLLESPFSQWWIRSATALGERIAGQQLILATMSPFASGEIARRLSRAMGVPWVADLRDPWALDEMQVYPSAVHRMLEKRRMERVLSTAALIVMNTPESARALKQELPRLRDKQVVTITNGFDSSDFDEPRDATADGTFRIVHSGYLHTDAGVRWSQRVLGGARSDVDVLTRSHGRLLEAMERWCDARPVIADRVELVLAGKATDKDRSLVTESRVASMVRFLGYLSHAESVGLVRGADLLFLPMHNLPRGARSRIVPGKTYEYMASARPILAAVPDGDARDFLKACGTALICRPDDVGEMVRILDRAYDQWVANRSIGRSDADFVARFERRHLARLLAEALHRALEQSGNGPWPKVVAPRDGIASNHGAGMLMDGRSH
jgi:glycosyltransferase involved in cell wall biosynthesis